MLTLGIDPGPNRSGYAIYESPLRPPGDKGRIIECGWVMNEEVIEAIYRFRLNRRWVSADPADSHVAIESIRRVFTTKAGLHITDTCRAEGRFQQAAGGNNGFVHLIPRSKVAAHLVGRANARDAGINSALRDRFGKAKVRSLHCGGGNHARDALAVAVYFDEKGRGELDSENQAGGEIKSETVGTASRGSDPAEV